MPSRGSSESGWGFCSKQCWFFSGSFLGTGLTWLWLGRRLEVGSAWGCRAGGLVASKAKEGCFCLPGTTVTGGDVFVVLCPAILWFCGQALPLLLFCVLLISPLHLISLPPFSLPSPPSPLLPLLETHTASLQGWSIGVDKLECQVDPWARGAPSLFTPPELGSHQLQNLGVGMAVYSVLFTKRRLCLHTHPAALDHGVGIPFLPDPTTASPTR